MFICFAFIGPCPYLSFVPATFLTVCASLVAQGFGCAAVLVASFASAQMAAVASGYPDSMEMQAVVSGLFTSSFALGNFCGPTISGVLYDIIGFEYNLLVLQALVVMVLVFNILAWLFPQKPDLSIEAPPQPTPQEEGNKTGEECKVSDAYPELPADIIRTRPVPQRPRKMKSFSSSSSVYERSSNILF